MSWINWYHESVDPVLIYRLKSEEDRIITETWKRQHTTIEQSENIPPDYDETLEEGPVLLTEFEFAHLWNIMHQQTLSSQIEKAKKAGRPQRLRIPISNALKLELVRQRGGICEHCNNHIFQQVHHIDGNPSNNDPSNLMLVCYDCHKWIESRTAKT